MALFNYKKATLKKANGTRNLRKVLLRSFSRYFNRDFYITPVGYKTPTQLKNIYTTLSKYNDRPLVMKAATTLLPKMVSLPEGIEFGYKTISPKNIVKMAWLLQAVLFGKKSFRRKWRKLYGKPKNSNDNKHNKK